MKALISGQAAVAVLIDESGLSSLHHGKSEPAPCSVEDIPYLLADATDVTELADTTIDEATAALDLSWRKDRALHLMLILLDSGSISKAREMSVDCLEDLLSDEHVLKFLAKRMHSAPLSESADLDGALILTESAKVLHHFLQGLKSPDTPTFRTVALRPKPLEEGYRYLKNR